jgi:hypothetical protein
VILEEGISGNGKLMVIMKKSTSYLGLLFSVVLLQLSLCSFSQSRGLKTITEKELRYHLAFLGATEFRGRETPSPELEIATLYLGNWLKSAGLKPVMGDGTFYQRVPLTVTSVFQPNTKIVLSKGIGERVYYFGKGFSGNFSVSGSYSGNAVFAGAGIHDPENGWDDLNGLDLSGKVVIILDVPRPGTGYASGSSLSGRLNSRISEIRKRGASAVLSIISPERENRMTGGFNIFDYIPTGRLGILYDSQRTDFGSGAQINNGAADNQHPIPFERAEISHEVAAEILDATVGEIAGMFEMIKRGQQVPTKEVPKIRIRLDVEVDSYRSASRNVIALIEGTDPDLKNEYIVICGHHDGRGIDDGEIIPGADDNGTATVALMEIAQALMTERPKRSVVLAWFSGEEQGMNGSHYFINNCPIPVEKISACLNMDMIGRNDPDSLFLVGSDLLSKGLDASINRVNKKQGINFGFDYRYSDPAHPQRVYFRSDHYPFIRFGIPGVWFFSGFTPDYHTPRDVPESVDYNKFFKTTRLVYLTAFDVGNMKEMLKLDVNPNVTTRGIHNITERSLFE